MTDTVNHPKHYNALGAKTKTGEHIECIDVVRCMSFNVGNAVKYLWRADEKGAPLEDLRKAIWYIEDEIRTREVFEKPQQPTFHAGVHIPSALAEANIAAEKWRQPLEAKIRQHFKRNPRLKNKTKQQLANKNDTPAPWIPAVGDKVIHSFFGRGTVTRVECNSVRALMRVVIRFPKIGAKDMTWHFCKDKLRPV